MTCIDNVFISIEMSCFSSTTVAVTVNIYTQVCIKCVYTALNLKLN